MSAPAVSESIVDYSGFDFARLWTGRERVTEVEQAIVGRALASGDRRRLLEVGTGFGRLLGPLESLGQEVVATDLDLDRLRSVRVRSQSSSVVRVAANLYHMPFVDGAFTGATMVRLHHHLLDPATALEEVGRVLRGGARLVVSYRPRPSVGTVVDDLQRALRSPGAGPFRSVTFSRGEVVLSTRPFPIRVAGRRQFVAEARRVGFELEPRSEVGAGFEEYSPLRRLPAELWVRLGTDFGRAPGFPTRFSILTRTGSSPGALPGLSRILACPRCREPQPTWFEAAALLCRGCGFVGTRHGPVLDLRYVPLEARRWSVGA